MKNEKKNIEKFLLVAETLCKPNAKDYCCRRQSHQDQPGSAAGQSQQPNGPTRQQRAMEFVWKNSSRWSVHRPKASFSRLKQILH